VLYGLAEAIAKPVGRVRAKKPAEPVPGAGAEPVQLV
jgi:hypothetical protein